MEHEAEIGELEIGEATHVASGVIVERRWFLKPVEIEPYICEATWAT